MMETNLESILERILDFASKIDRTKLFSEKYSMNLTQNFPPPPFFKKSPNVARFF